MDCEDKIRIFCSKNASEGGFTLSGVCSDAEFIGGNAVTGVCQTMGLKKINHQKTLDADDIYAYTCSNRKRQIVYSIACSFAFVSGEQRLLVPGFRLKFFWERKRRIE